MWNYYDSIYDQPILNCSISLFLDDDFEQLINCKEEPIITTTLDFTKNEVKPTVHDNELKETDREKNIFWW
jgi:hypothetical protein